MAELWRLCEVPSSRTVLHAMLTVIYRRRKRLRATSFTAGIDGIPALSLRFGGTGPYGCDPAAIHGGSRRAGRDAAHRSLDSRGDSLRQLVSRCSLGEVGHRLDARDDR